VSTGRQKSGQPQAQATDRVRDAAALLDEVLDNYTGSEKTKVIEKNLVDRVETIRSLLPDALKEHAERFVARAKFTFAQSAQLQKCSPASFVQCVLRAAECGLAIDGKLAYAVPYNVKKKDANGKPYWVDEAQFQPSYKGLIACARRTGQIVDIYGDIICKNDHWKYVRRGGADEFEHERAPLGTDRGETIGAYQKIVLSDGHWRVEVMDILELNAIMARSKAAKSGFSPWQTDLAEMQKKTVVHRALKTYSDDPGLMVALDAMEASYEPLEERPATNSRVARSSINDRLDAMPTHANGDADYEDDGPAAEEATDATPPAEERVDAPEDLERRYADMALRISEASAIELPGIKIDIDAARVTEEQRVKLNKALAERKKELGK